MVNAVGATSRPFLGITQFTKNLFVRKSTSCMGIVAGETEIVEISGHQHERIRQRKGVKHVSHNPVFYN